MNDVNLSVMVHHRVDLAAFAHRIDEAAENLKCNRMAVALGGREIGWCVVLSAVHDLDAPRYKSCLI